jgi:hypothetical protein
MNEENSLISPATPRRARGDGSILQKRYKDKRTGETKRTVTLYMKFYVNGKPRTESTGTTKLGEAKKALRRRLASISTVREETNTGSPRGRITRSGCAAPCRPATASGWADPRAARPPGKDYAPACRA